MQQLMAVDPPRAKGTGPLDFAALEEMQRDGIAKTLGPVAAPKRQETQAHDWAAARERPHEYGGIYLFWFVMVFSAAAIITTLAIR